MRFASKAKDAVKMANMLCSTLPTAELHWLKPIVCTVPLKSAPEEDKESDTDDGPKIILEFESELDPEQVLLGDILDGDNEDNDEKDAVAPEVEVT